MQDGINTNKPCLREKYYSKKFLTSPFYQGWKYLVENENRGNCKKAMEYFAKSLNRNLFRELASLYIDYCSFPQKNNILENTNIYQGRHQKNQIDEDEFKWLINLALCESVVEQYAFGKMLYDGFIIEQNIEQGLIYLTLAAKEDHIQAQKALAKALDEQGESDVAKMWREKTRQLRAKYY